MGCSLYAAQERIYPEYLLAYSRDVRWQVEYLDEEVASDECHDIMWWWHSDTSRAWSEQQFWTRRYLETMVPEIGHLHFINSFPYQKYRISHATCSRKALWSRGKNHKCEINTFARWKVERLSWAGTICLTKAPARILVVVWVHWGVCKDNNPKFHNAHTGWGCWLHSEKKEFQSRNTVCKV